MNEIDELTEEERNELDRLMSEGLCKCGHRRNEHSKFVEGKFDGCQHFNCPCNKFEWADISIS